MHIPTLFHDPTSEPSRSVHWFSAETGIELQLEYVWLTRGQHRTPEFMRVNPAHQVPALKHGDFCLSEASAILHYLAELADCQGQWVGESADQRAVTNRFLSWHHTNTRLKITLEYVLPVLLMPAYNGDPAPPAEAVGQRRDRARESLALLEFFLGEQGRFLGGVTPSIADLFIACDLFALDIDPERGELMDPFPGVSRWLEALRERPGYLLSHAQWNAVVPRVVELLSAPDTSCRNPAWVADVCLQPRP